ncbi:FAD synthase [Thermogymnomonas acidicola]|uniref:FAD synthase n=1 Tax=Thermogymnomonas acidicola TaxID=399579 RepID=A0AA37F9H2_9ARCH|nr:adenylyltransferase/cytidyltransferase family protein [Thermogymnomonas acidicola]GGM74461.1 FAD synthase [Thermogymnomonas acidicola]
MVRVMATGVFDILHPGHLHFLRESKKLGDELYVVVARDSTARKNGKRLVFNERIRLEIISELRMVDVAILGHEGDIYRTVVEVRPDIITLGYDQKFSEAEIERNCRALGLNTRVVRISKYSNPDVESSSDVRKRILQLVGDGS